ncbi:MAG: family transposase [Rubritepida sp.]|nr:family transposase [Rubritepida sp.]
MSSYILRIPHTPISDPEWLSLLPHLTRTHTTGRPCPDLRAHLNAIFHIAATDGPWRILPPEHGKADTVSRYFRRLTHAGFWERLLTALAAAPPDHPLRRIEALICRAARRAMRLRGLRLIALARRLKLLRALPGPPALIANPSLSEIVFSLPIPMRMPETRRGWLIALRWLRLLRKLITIAAGRRRLSRAVRARWL